MQDDFEVDRRFRRQRAVLLCLVFLILASAAVCEFARPLQSPRDPRCEGPARYEAMREAHERGRPQPC